MQGTTLDYVRRTWPYRQSECHITHLFMSHTGGRCSPLCIPLVGVGIIVRGCSGGGMKPSMYWAPRDPAPQPLLPAQATKLS